MLLSHNTKNRDKEAETIVIDALHKVFTSGQIIMLTSIKNQVKSSAEDEYYISDFITIIKLMVLKNVKRIALYAATLTKLS